MAGRRVMTISASFGDPETNVGSFCEEPWSESDGVEEEVREGEWGWMEDEERIEVIGWTRCLLRMVVGHLRAVRVVLSRPKYSRERMYLASRLVVSAS